MEGMTPEELANRCCLDSGHDPLTTRVRSRIAADSGAVGEHDAWILHVTTPIDWRERHGGLGYVAYSNVADVDREETCTAMIAQAFAQRELPTKVLVVPIDLWYRFQPHNPSLVGKTTQWCAMAPENTGPQSAIILSGYSQSRVFNTAALTDIPCQREAGLLNGDALERGKRLERFAHSGISRLLTRHGGDIAAVLDELSDDAPIENAELLLATSLLLQDRQQWQNLWYERQSQGTALCIVAPQPFHDAMNRLNHCWGHGTYDYRYRAVHSLGVATAPGIASVRPYEVQGLRREPFFSRVLPIIERYERNG